MAHSSIGLPPDSTGKKIHTHSHTVEGEQVHNQIFTLGDPVNADRFQTIDSYGAATVRFQGGGFDFDSFGKAKISQEKVLATYTPTYSTMPEKFTEEISGTASSIHLPDESSIKASIGSASGDSIIRTTNRYHKYTPGISQTVMMTTSMGDAGKTNLVRKWGYFDAEDGLYFEKNDEFNVVLRSSVTGSVVEERISQANFNGDKCDGTGVSGMVIDLTKANIFWIDFQWLGVGVARFGVYSEQGTKILVHKFQNSNKNISVYMKSGSLPIRYEMYNTGVTASTSEMRLLNAVVLINNVDMRYRGKHQASGSATGSLTNTYQNMITLRPKALFNGLKNRGIVIPNHLNLHSTKPIAITIVKNPVYADIGIATWSDGLGANPLAEYSLDNAVADPTVYSNLGTFMDTKIFQGVTMISLEDIFDYFNECLMLKADGTNTDTYAILAKTMLPLDTDDVIGSLHWEDIHI